MKADKAKKQHRPKSFCAKHKVRSVAVSADYHTLWDSGVLKPMDQFFFIYLGLWALVRVSHGGILYDCRISLANVTEVAFGIFNPGLHWKRYWPTLTWRTPGEWVEEIIKNTRCLHDIKCHHDGQFLQMSDSCNGVYVTRSPWRQMVKIIPHKSKRIEQWESYIYRSAVVAANQPLDALEEHRIRLALEAENRLLRGNRPTDELFLQAIVTRTDVDFNYSLLQRVRFMLRDPQFRQTLAICPEPLLS